MNRKERRLLAKRGPVFSEAAPGHGPADAPPSIADLMDEARRNTGRATVRKPKVCADKFSRACRRTFTVSI